MTTDSWTITFNVCRVRYIYILILFQSLFLFLCPKALSDKTVSQSSTTATTHYKATEKRWPGLSLLWRMMWIGCTEILFSLPRKNTVPVVGITGPPGAGKSTLINALVRSYSESGKQVAVVAVDPTSPFNYGSLLGDRLRMSNILPIQTYSSVH